MKPFEETLEVASAEWVGAGLITDVQRAAILARHPAKAGSNTRFVGIIATIGGLLFAVGVSLVIKSNWAAIGDWTKIAGLVALLVGAYAAGWKLKADDGGFPKTGDACLMVGGIFFLCGIALVSQIFHLNSRPATGVLIWWLGIAAVPWLARAKGAQFLSIVAGLVWFGNEMVTSGSWIEMSTRTSGHGHDETGIIAVFLFLGIALWLSGLGLRRTSWRDFAGVHEKWGIVLVFGVLYLLGFARHGWRFSHREIHALDATAIAACSVALALAVAAAVMAGRRSRQETKALWPWLALTLVPAFGVIGVGPLGDEGWLWSAVAWLTLFTLSVATVRVGLESGREGWVNLGVLCIAVNIITRYFDLFGSMLEGGVFFIVTGVLVIGLGIFFEKKRRALLAQLRKESHS